MSVIRNYIIPRILTYFGLIFIGFTICFVVIRISPLDPVRSILSRYEAIGQIYDPESYQNLKESLEELFGLKGSLWDQYLIFIKRMFSGDLGPSLSAFPAPVSEIIYNSLPRTIGLLSVTVMISWLIGNILGGIVGYFSDKKWAKVLASFAMVIYPIPYYILSLTLILFLVYLFPVFPTTGGVTIGVKPSFSLEFVADVLYHAFLPGLSLVVAGYG